MDIESARVLQDRFGSGQPRVIARAPGRVNLIGEHTDYNEGYVLPFAIDRYTEVALRPRSDSQFMVYSATLDQVFSSALPIQNPEPSGNWSDYLVGILNELFQRCRPTFGFEAAIVGNVPLEAGLSSSASLEITIAVGLSQLYELELLGLEIVQLCRRAENEFVGVPCGIMDQYIVYFAESEYALLLDTRTMESHLVPLQLEGMDFLVVDSTVRRNLSRSGYTERRHECEQARHWFSQMFPERKISSLRDINEATLYEVKSKMPDELWRRARHVVEENARVLAMVETLKLGNALEAGRLLSASHNSLRDLFQVSTNELDFLVDFGLEHGALGARMVGGGFGGVTLHLVPAKLREDYISVMQDAYRRRFGLRAEVIQVRPSPGASVFQVKMGS